MELWWPWMFSLASGLPLVVALRIGLKPPGHNPFRTIIQVISGVLCVPLAAVPLLLLLLNMFCQSHSPLIGSPDGRHVARVQVSDALGAVVDPVASVAVRKSWSPAWSSAYVGFGIPGRSGRIEPRVRWVDNSHLLIEYPYKPDGDPTKCLNRVGDILIQCRAHDLVTNGSEE